MARRFQHWGLALLLLCTPALARAASVSLAWDASPSPGVTAYHVHIGTAPGVYTNSVNAGLALTYTVQNLANDQGYYFAATAMNIAGTQSPKSTEVFVQIPPLPTLPPAADTTKPSAATPLVAVAGAAMVSLAWPAATDNVGVLEYQVERCTGSGCTTWSLLATTPALLYTDEEVTNGTTYRYRVRARDAAGNTGPWSNNATVRPAATARRVNVTCTEVMIECVVNP